MTAHERRSARFVGAASAPALLAALPAAASAHALGPVYESSLPLAAYLVGAAAVVALSFGVVIARDVRAPSVDPGRPVAVPAAVRLGLRVVGLWGWAWIMAQGIAGGTSDASVASLFLWVYGWVGVAVVSALAFPVWEWLDPFATLFDIGAWALRRLGVRSWAPWGLPARARTWPAVVGLACFAWLELVVVPGSRTLTWVLAGYTALTLVLMAQSGRDAWRAEGETFTVWFRTLNRLAPFGLAPEADPDGRAVADGTSPRVVRRDFGAGLLGAAWSTPHIVLVALAVASILYDGLSETTEVAGLLGSPGIVVGTLEFAAWAAVVVGLALAVARSVSRGAIGAGLLPVAVGYLVAHNLTYLLVDGQRIVIALSDPLAIGANLFGTASFQVQAGWLPPGLLWTLEVVAVVGGHMMGAWAGHVTAQRDMDAIKSLRPPRDLRHRKIHTARLPVVRNIRPREVPLAIVMVALSTITLWSLGQATVQQGSVADAAPQAVSRAVSRAP